MSKNKVAAKKAKKEAVVFTIARQGWYGENRTMPILKISKESRKKLGVEPNQAVYVELGSKREVAIVSSIHKELVPYVNICEVNNVLAERLEAVSGNEVTISKGVTEKEALAVRTYVVPTPQPEEAAVDDEGDNN